MIRIRLRLLLKRVLRPFRIFHRRKMRRVDGLRAATLWTEALK